MTTRSQQRPATLVTAEPARPSTGPPSTSSTKDFHVQQAQRHGSNQRNSLAVEVRGPNLNLGLCWCASASYQKCPWNTKQCNLAIGSGSRSGGEDWQRQALFVWQPTRKQSTCSRHMAFTQCAADSVLTALMALSSVTGANVSSRRINIAWSANLCVLGLAACSFWSGFWPLPCSHALCQHALLVFSWGPSGSLMCALFFRKQVLDVLGVLYPDVLQPDTFAKDSLYHQFGNVGAAACSKWLTKRWRFVADTPLTD